MLRRLKERAGRMRRFLTAGPGQVREPLGATANAKKGGVDARVAEYWTDHNVTNHLRFTSREELLDFFQWRNDQYYDYINLMPISDRNDQVVLDFGCGPGHDLVGFAEFSGASRIIGIDVSSSSLAEARERLVHYGGKVELLLAPAGEFRIPLADRSVDYIHCSGVLHHIPDPGPVLGEFRRILKPSGVGRAMIYHRESLWYHLYVAHQLRLLNPRFRGARPGGGLHPVHRWREMPRVALLLCRDGCRAVRRRRATMHVCRSGGVGIRDEPAPASFHRDHGRAPAPGSPRLPHVSALRRSRYPPQQGDCRGDRCCFRVWPSLNGASAAAAPDRGFPFPRLNAAWLAHQSGGLGVGSSNLPAPTKR